MEATTESINDRTTALLGFDLRESIRTAKRLQEEAAQWRAEAEYQEHLRKVVLSEEILNAHKDAGKRLTGPEAEAIARTSQTYRDHLLKLRNAARERGQTYAKAQAAERAVELGFRQLSFLQTELRGQDR